MRISDWSSDVCSSDLHRRLALEAGGDLVELGLRAGQQTRGIELEVDVVQHDLRLTNRAATGVDLEAFRRVRASIEIVVDAITIAVLRRRRRRQRATPRIDLGARKSVG